VLKLLAVSRCWKPTSYFTRFITPGEWSIVMTESVCVCLSTSISPELQVRSSPKFCCILPVTVAWSSSGGTVRRSVLPVLWMTSCLLICQGCLTSPPSKFTCSLGLGYKRCAVIPVAGQQTHGPIFQALKVTPQVAAVGAVCGLFYDWLVFENSSVLGAAQVYRGKHRITCDNGAALLLNNFVIMWTY